MTRAITGAVAVVPRWELEGLRVPGPDEDEFTLAAAAIEPLGLRAGTVFHWVGSPPAMLQWSLRELVGGAADLESHPPGVRGFLEAIASALPSDHGGPDAVIVAVETPALPAAERLPTGTAAVAFHVTDAPGLELTVLDEPPPGGSQPPGPFPAYRGPLAQLAWELHRVGRSPGGHGNLAVPESTARPTFLGYRGEGPVTWLGAWDALPEPSLPMTRPQWIARASTDAHRVSEGAYVPRQRYLEDLPSRWRFVADRCPTCKVLTFPARGACRQCRRSSGLEQVGLPREGGTVLASTVVGRGGQPTEFDAQVEAFGSYGVVLVELAPGARGTLQVADAGPTGLRIGDRVATRLRRLYPMEGEWRYGRKATPLSD